MHTPSAPPVAARHESPGASALETLVGERTVPDLWHENYWFRRHEAAYLRLAPLLAAATHDAVVVEAGAGEGYGTALLRAAGCARVVAVDYDAASVRHGAARYPGAAWSRGNLARLPFAAGSVAAVASFQVIEHLWTPWEFLAECSRVLRPDGPLVVTTPNRPVFSPGVARGERPPNPFHVREFDADELRDTVAAHLVVESVLGVAHGPRLRGWEVLHGDVVAAQLGTPPSAWGEDLTAFVASVTADDFELVDLWRTPRPLDEPTASTSPATTGSSPAAPAEGNAGDAVGLPPVHDLVVIARRAAA